MSAFTQDSIRLLNAIFPGIRRGKVYVGHSGNWHPQAANSVGLSLPLALGAYFCPSVMVEGLGATGKTLANAEKVMVLVLDDVGTKIDRDEFEMLCGLEPSYRIETSPGNFQYGWIIRGGMEMAEYAALRTAMDGWLAPVMKGVTHADAKAGVQWVRLPQGANPKPEHAGFQTRLESCGLGDYPGSELWKHFGAGGSPAGAKVASPVAPETASAAEVAAVLALIPNDGVSGYCATHNEWMKVGLAIRGATGKSQEGEVLWTDWVNQQAQARRDAASVWNSNDTRHLGYQHLLRWAKEHAPDAAAAERFNDGAEMPDVDEEAEVQALQRDVANEIVRKYGDRLRFNVDTGQWHKFDGVWKPSPFLLGFRLAKRWADGACLGNQLGKAARATVSKASFYEGVEKILRADEAIAVTLDEFDRDDWLLGTPGGTVDLRTGVLRLALPGDMISKSTLVTPSVQEDCPFWKKRLIGWMTTVAGKPDLEMQRFLQQWAGYCLTGDTTEEKLLFLYGDGANGKGSYVETLAGIMGDYYVEPATDLFMAKKNTRHQQEIAALAGARMVATAEVPATGDWDEMLLNKVTGGGTISANYMRQNQFTFRLRFKVLISGNDKPTFAGRITEAIKRRFLLATFPNVAKPADPAFKPGLMKEAAGILRWAINGLVAMQAGGGLLVPTSVQDATASYLADEDLFGSWLKARTVKAVGGTVGATDLRNDWVEYRNSEGNHNLIDNHRKFGEEMARKGHKSKKVNSGWVYPDIVLKSKAKSTFDD